MDTHIIADQMFFARNRDALKRLLLTFQKEGFIPTLKLLGHYVFSNTNYFIYEHTLQARDEADFFPRVENVTMRVISSNHAADMLASHGNDFREYMNFARQSPDKGALVFCFFIDGELAHVGFVALTEEAKNTFDTVPYLVDFSHKEACTGGTFTPPKFRGKGLMKYGYFKRFQYLYEHGIRVSRNAVTVNNIVSQRVHAKFNPRIYAKAQHVKFLWWNIRYKVQQI
jgi:hypothetical protein